MEKLTPFPTAMRIETNDGIVVEFPPQTIRDLTYIAVKNELDFGTALTQAVANEMFLLDLEGKGYRLIIQQSDGVLRELVRTDSPV